MIEYHRVVKVYDDENNFQIFVFRVDRDVIDNTLQLVDMWLVTRHNSYESKVRINIDGLMEKIFHNPEPMTEKEVDRMYSLFNNVIDEDVKLGRKLEQVESEIDMLVNEETDLLLRASEIALSAHPVSTDLDEIIRNINNK